VADYYQLCKTQFIQKCMPNGVTWGIVTSVNAGDGCAKPVGGVVLAPERLVHSVPDILFKVTIPHVEFLGIHFCYCKRLFAAPAARPAGVISVFVGQI